ncbi:MAG: DUF4147 domain-containing protein [Pseudomonadota bacterium]|nr:DUF4147 domain-containing protein [Pseudomonadota bacterium]
MDLRARAVDIFRDAVASILPERLLAGVIQADPEGLRIGRRRYPWPAGRKLWLLGSGKASLTMARAALEILGRERVAGGLVISSYDDGALGELPVAVGSHPLPDERSLAATERLMELMGALSREDLFVYFLSGGSSALLEKPLPPITLNDLRETHGLLMTRSIPIEEMNVVRKHLSMVKGGRLAARTKARGAVLVMSDVIGDDLEAIGSAPLYRDRSTYREARRILDYHGLWPLLPASVRGVVEAGDDGTLPETPKEAPRRIAHHVIAGNARLLRQAQLRAAALGMEARIVTSSLRGEAREVAKVIMAVGEEARKRRRSSRPLCLLWGGETTVTLRGRGRGGRNQELCLAFLRELRSRRGLCLLSAGTDGIDGNSDAAGAVVDAASHHAAVQRGLSLEDYLQDNNANEFFRQTGDLVVTGPTGVNVMDLTLLLATKE